jgi:hypothetical protein
MAKQSNYFRHVLVKKKFIYGGMLVDKYFCELDNGDTIQVRQSDYDLNKVGEPFMQTITKEPVRKSKVESMTQPIHKTCPSWGETVCRRGLFVTRPPKTTERWNRVTCPKCLALRSTSGTIKSNDSKRKTK